MPYSESDGEGKMEMEMEMENDPPLPVTDVLQRSARVSIRP